MPSTYHLYQGFGQISPTESGTNLFSKCKYNVVPTIQESTINRIYSFDSTADYLTFTPTGMVGYYDSQFGMRGVGSSRYILDGSSPTPNIKYPSSSYYDTGVDSYKTGSLYIYSEHALQFRLDLQLQDSGGNSVGSTYSSNNITLTPNQWTRVEAISGVNAVRFLMTLNVLNFNSATDSGKTFYVDSVQLEDKRYSTSFHNSSTRSASQISFTLPKQGPDYTVVGWAKIGNHASAAAAGVAPFFTLYNGSSDYATIQYSEAVTKVQAFKDDTDPNTDFATSALDCDPGDLVFVALVNDGLNLTVYAGKNGGSLLTASQSTDFSVFDTIMIGRNPAGNYMNGPVEQVLMYKKALTQQQVEAIFNSATPLDYSSSTDIVFAYGTPSTLGTSKAMSYSGSGSYRAKGVTVSLDLNSITGASAFSEYTGSNATHIAEGSDCVKLEKNGFIATGTDLTQANIYRVTDVWEITNAGRAAFVFKV